MLLFAMHKAPQFVTGDSHAWVNSQSGEFNSSIEKFLLDYFFSICHFFKTGYQNHTLEYVTLSAGAHISKILVEERDRFYALVEIKQPEVFIGRVKSIGI